MPFNVTKKSKKNFGQKIAYIVFEYRRRYRQQGWQNPTNLL